MGHPDDIRTEEMSAEQRADLDALRASVEGVEPVSVSVPERAGLSLADELAGYVLLAVPIIQPMLPSVAAIYTPEVTKAAAAAVAAVCEKYGWLQGGMGSKYQEEIAAVVILGPLAFATIKAGKADMAALKKKPEKPELEAANDPVWDTVQAVPSPQTVTFGNITG